MDAQQAERLFRQWRGIEAKVAELQAKAEDIKRRLGEALLGTPGGRRQRTKSLSAPSADADPLAGVVGPAATGTKGRAVLEIIATHGGIATVSQISDGLPPDDGVTRGIHVRRARGVLRYLAKHGFVAKERRGAWRLTDKGHVVLGSVQTPTRAEEDTVRH